MPLQHLGASLHSHIRIVPRSKIESEREEDDIPTWRSPSLQAPISDQQSRKGSVQSEASTSNTTFAQMARRIGNAEQETFEKTASNGLGTLSNMLKLQSKRNWKGNKSWRSLEPTHLSTDEDFSLTDNDSSSPVDLFNHDYLESDGTSSAKDNLPKASPFNLPKIQTKGATLGATAPVEASVQNSSTTVCDDSDNISPMDTWPHHVEDYMRVFGHLPDVIRLHEKTGDSEGELMFIGHPNRDVSAHQWRVSSYQWINIGTFSEKRKRIEGSLATDRLLNTELKYNTLEYFKAVAENREKKAKERGSMTEEPATIGASSGSSAALADNSRGTSGVGTKTANGHETITSKQLEDPFVSKSEAPRSAGPVSFNFRGPDPTVPGSMDFGYEFPRKPPSMNSERHHIYIERERERLQHLRVDSPELRQPPAHLREVDFGEAALSEVAMSEASEVDRAEEAASAAAASTPPTFRMDYSHFNYVPPSDTYPDRAQFDNKVSVPGPTHRSCNPAEQRVALPEFSVNKFEYKNANTAGRTVANPYRVPSTLNAAAPPYQMPGMAKPSDMKSSTPALNFKGGKPDPSLRSGRPDDLRQENPYPIAEESNQKAPTKQNFRGPFFSQSMPTTYEPTASLTVQMSDKEKIASWYRDGQNVHRQRDYAKTLISAASSSKARDSGLIGQGVAREGDSKYQNTHFFARVYENLFQYAEESRAGSWSVFTSKFKAPILQYRDLSASGNNSFYTERAFMSPIAVDHLTWTHQLPGSNSTWTGSGSNNHPYAPAWRINAPPGAYITAGSGRL